MKDFSLNLKLLFFTCTLVLCLNDRGYSRQSSQIDIKGTIFDVEVAILEAEILQGLMNRKTMADNAGMLFVFPALKRASFWMKDTYISLDIIFLNSYNQVIWIFPSAKPFSQEILRCPMEAKHVLEIKGGTSERLNLQIGDNIKIIMKR